MQKRGITMKKNPIYKLIALTLCVVLALSMFAGCASKAAEAPAAEAPAETPAAEAPAAEETAPATLLRAIWST